MLPSHMCTGRSCQTLKSSDLADLAVSPNDVLFFLHHAVRVSTYSTIGLPTKTKEFQHLDCIWQKWQQRRSINAKAYGGGLTEDLNNFDTYPVGAPPLANVSSMLPTAGLTRPVAVREVMATKGEYLCYQCIW